MIPFSARSREGKVLAGHTFAYSPNAVADLEAAVCNYHGTAHAVAFNTPESATAALLAVTDIARGDRVVAAAMAPPHHFGALAQTGAEIRYCDIGRDGNLYPSALAAAIDADTRAVLSGNFEGIRAAPNELPASVARIEDFSALLSPAWYKGSFVWSLESVMPAGLEKTGFVLTGDDALASALYYYRAQGRKEGALWNYDLVMHGADAALGDVSASVALRQMDILPSICERLSENVVRLDERLDGQSLFDRMDHAPGAALRSYPVLLIPQLYCPKEDIFTAIRDDGVELSVCCKPAYKTTAFKDGAMRLPVTEDVYKALLQLPCHHALTSAELGTVADVLLGAVETYGYRGCRF